MPRNDLFDDARKRLGGLFGGAQEQTQKEIDPAKLSEGAKMQLARQGRAERSGVSKPKGIAGGLRGDVTQALGKAAGVISQQNRVVTANPQQRQGMRFDPRSRGGQGRTADRVQSPVPQSAVRSPAAQTNLDAGGRGGADARVGGPQAHVKGGGMKGYSQMGYDDSDISSAERAYANSDRLSREAGSRVIFGTAKKQGLKTGAFAGILTAMGAPLSAVAQIAAKTFMTGMFGPAMAFGAMREFYNGYQINRGFEDAGLDVDPNSEKGKDWRAHAARMGLGRDESKDYFKSRQDADYVGGDYEVAPDPQMSSSYQKQADQDLEDESRPLAAGGGEGNYSMGSSGNNPLNDPGNPQNTGDIDDFGGGIMSPQSYARGIRQAGGGGGGQTAGNYSGGGYGSAGSRTGPRGGSSGGGGGYGGSSGGGEGM